MLTFLFLMPYTKIKKGSAWIACIYIFKKRKKLRAKTAYHLQASRVKKIKINQASGRFLAKRKKKEKKENNEMQDEAEDCQHAT